MQRKIFIGIDLPQAVKKRLMQKIEKWKDLPVRWSREENLHITLSFLGHVDDEMLSNICEKVCNAVEEIDIFDMDMSKIELGPEGGKDAKMFWFSGEASDELKKLQSSIERELGFFHEDKKVFRPHITLGRIKQYGWQRLKEIPEIQEDFHVSVPVESVEIIESTMLDGKRKFMVIESCPLKY
ncbi:MAG: RNA 2',3'-cyclic phosphodiesterase [Candidatus Moranbacteria bacterium]|nr:RNA 2',3'-cyclic phosphodiesterase [Candidatus Moranbacteria bacterium]